MKSSARAKTKSKANGLTRWLRVFILFATAVVSWSSANAGLAKYTCNGLEWRIVAEIGEVKDQCATGSCWAVSGSSLIENFIQISRNESIEISPEYALIMDRIRKAKVYLANVDAGSGRVTSADRMLYERDDSRSKAAIRYGVVPAGVLDSRVISSSQNWMFNAKVKLDKEITRLIDEGLGELAGADRESRTSLLKQFNQKFDELGESFLRRRSEHWRVGPDGVQRFKHKDRFYTPQEFLSEFVFGGKPYELVTLKIGDAKFEDLMNRLLESISKSQTVVVGLDWNAESRFTSLDAVFPSDAGIKHVRHAMEVVGVVRNEKTRKIVAIRVKNSAGEGFGDRGFVDIELKFFRQSLSQLSYLQPK